MDSEKISTFMSVTSADSERARIYLEATHGDLDAAVAMFYAAGEEEGQQQQQQPAHAAPSAGPAAAEDRPRRAPQQQPQKQPQAASGGRFVTMDALRSRHGGGGGGGESGSDDSDDDQGAQAFYVGGSELGGGQQVLGPPGSRRAADAGHIASNLFASARRHGATEVSGSADDPSGHVGGAFAAFAGRGLRLDSDQLPPAGGPAVDTSSTDAAATNQQPVCRVLKLWSNGVSIDDGPLRAFEEPATRELLRSVAQGRVPPELRSDARGARVDLQLEDHRDTEYRVGGSVGVGGKFRAFAGSGNVLGSPAPAASVQQQPQLPQPPAESGVGGGASAVPVDASQPTTNLNVRLPSGGRPLVVTLNPGQHTVADLRRYLCAERPDLASRGFVFLTTFPTAEIGNEEQTLQAAGLVNAAVIVRTK